MRQVTPCALQCDTRRRMHHHLAGAPAPLECGPEEASDKAKVKDFPLSTGIHSDNTKGREWQRKTKKLF